jgi:bifunctional enzyme CysN/CysC
MIVNFTGIDAPYEPPPAPDLALAAADASPEYLAERLIAQLQQRGIL